MLSIVSHLTLLSAVFVTGRRMNRLSSPSIVQLAKLISILEGKSWLANGHARTTTARLKTRKAWHEIAIVLNAIGEETGQGCTKSRQRWGKFWKDKKAATKRKYHQILTKKKNGIVVDEDLELNIYEQRILRLTEESHENTAADKDVSDNEDVKEEIVTEIPDSEPESQASMSMEESQIEMNTSPSNWEESGSGVVRETVYVKSSNQNLGTQRSTSVRGGASLQPHSELLSPTQRRLRALRRRQFIHQANTAKFKDQDYTEQLIAIEERRSRAELISARALEKIANSVSQVAQSWTNLGQALVPMARAFTNWANNNLENNFDD